MPGIAVVVCCHRLDRLPLLRRALASLENQSTVPDQVVVVIDGDAELYAALTNRADRADRTDQSDRTERMDQSDQPDRAGRTGIAASAEELRYPDVTGIPETTILTTGYRSGLSHARNVGLAAVDAEHVAFLDDDAEADPFWLQNLVGALAADTRVLGAGGVVVPDWAGGVEPRWFPREMLWTVGCSYQDPTPGPVRNLFGGCALFRRNLFDQIGGFDSRLGRRHSGGDGCEETELCMRAAAANPGGFFVLVGSASMLHRVHAERQSPRYLLRRCWGEGRSKATLRMIAASTYGASGRPTAASGLGPEIEYLTRILPAGVVSGLAAAAHGDPAGLARAGL